jgi:hypothetical protein
LIPLNTIRRFLGTLEKIQYKHDFQEQIDFNKIVWAVKTADKYLKKSTCLTRALTAQYLITKRGYKADLKIGVAKGSNKNIEAHAWVESCGKIIIGGDIEDFNRYTPFPSLDIKLAKGFKYK